jgi:uncharacterized protein YqiB (DUF1249 family)
MQRIFVLDLPELERTCLQNFVLKNRVLRTSHQFGECFEAFLAQSTGLFAGRDESDKVTVSISAFFSF